MVACSHCQTVFSDDLAVLESNPDTRCGTCGEPFKQKCGCGRHFIDTLERTALFENKTWKLPCLFMKVDKRAAKIMALFQKLKADADQYQKMKTKFTKMKKYLRNQPCVNCKRKLGNRFRQYNEDFVCGRCAR